MIIGRAGGPGDEPIEKVAGAEEWISLPRGETAQHTTGVLLNLLLMHCVFVVGCGGSALQDGSVIKQQGEELFVYTLKKLQGSLFLLMQMRNK